MFRKINQKNKVVFLWVNPVFFVVCWNPSSTFDARFLLRPTLGSHKRWLRQLGPWYPHGKLWLGSWICFDLNQSQPQGIWGVNHSIRALSVSAAKYINNHKKMEQKEWQVANVNILHSWLKMRSFYWLQIKPNNPKVSFFFVCLERLAKTRKWTVKGKPFTEISKLSSLLVFLFIDLPYYLLYMC